MNVLKNGLFVAVIFFLFSCRPDQIEVSGDAISIPIAGNTYVTSGKGDAFVSTEGISRWSGGEAILSSWFKLSKTGKLHLFLKAKPDGVSELNISCAGQNFTVELTGNEETVVPVGKVDIHTPGYVRVDIKGISKEGDQFPVISELIIDGEAALPPVYYVHDFETYWALRGPSVHMNYALPEMDVEYFYNEITVPEGEDKIGSYFMANGFGEGYCGIQVNNETERRVLFSVWSPFSTDIPSDIPEEQRIKLLGKGENVHVGEFGNEGSGGQSYLVYPWEAGETYRFLTRVCPDGKGNTQYYAWFRAPGEEEQWQLIAGFLRPQTNTWYTKAHSFLENFIPEQGYLSRSVLFGNQWVRTTKGEWYELIEGVFTYDATAKAQVRLDYTGGVEGDCFYLKNGGFFNENTEINSIFTRLPKNNMPKIETDKLPVNSENH
ncbi:MAG: DUF3472 domain-containing protein [Tannerellaceae bacterium]|jgi:hypothetical protein|nr:DUF3472 domain-containing protein [Tannerellaceae bacterium]